MSTYRILALDGGGIRGLVTASLLKRLCMEPGLDNLLDSVDLIAGTSSGGLIALAMAHGLACRTMADTLGKISTVFEHGDRTFGKASPWWLGGHWLRTKYRTEPTRNCLVELFGDHTLGQLQKHVLIAAFDLDNEGQDNASRSWKPKLFHNFPGENTDQKELVWKVGLRTSAAPSYFPTFDGNVDGGVYSNNPAMCALAQAFDRRYGPAATELSGVVLFSVGAGLNLNYIGGPSNNWGLLPWSRKFVELVMDGTVGIAHYQCNQLLPEGHYYRLAPAFAPTTHIGLDDVRSIESLKTFANKEVDIRECAKWLRQHWMPQSTAGGTVEAFIS
jgi:Patatin-like phospholipase